MYPIGVDVGLKRRLYHLLGGDSDARREMSTEPFEIGCVPLWQSQILGLRLREEGFHAQVVDGQRADGAWLASPTNMARIYVAKCEAVAAQERLDELTAT